MVVTLYALQRHETGVLDLQVTLALLHLHDARHVINFLACEALLPRDVLIE